MEYPTIVRRPNPVTTAHVAGTMHYTEDGRTACGMSLGVGRWSDRGRWPWQYPWGVSAKPCGKCLKRHPIVPNGGPDA